MKVIVIYDNFALAAKASRMFERAAREAGEIPRQAGWNPRLWRVDLLTLPGTAKAVLSEAAGADLLLLALRRTGPLPASLADWLDLWAMRRQVADAALAFWDGKTSRSAAAPPLPELSQFALRHNVTLVLSGTEANEAASNSRPPAAAANVIELNESNFEQEVLDANSPVLVQFWAGWSESSKAMAPVLESIAETHDLPVKVARLNVEQHEDLVEEYGVRAVPTCLIFNDGSLQDQIVGRTTEREVRRKLGRIVG